MSIVFNPQSHANESNPIEQIVKPGPVPKVFKSSPIYEGRGDGETTCPVTGEKITNKNYRLAYAGREVYFCCKGCFQRGKHNPEKYLKATLAEQKLAVKAYLAKALKPIDGGEVCDE
ncbi:MAG: YHS domain-containing protein [Methylococcaceae bacterium]|nr:YHS domain-containing protein [Methylococcaceae bacterium]